MRHPDSTFQIPIRILPDVFLLFGLLLILAGTNFLFGVKTSAHFVIAFYVGLLFLPGWFIAHSVPPLTGSLLERCYFAVLISVIVYGLISFTCFVLALSFNAFFAIYGSAIFLAGMLGALRQREDSALSLLRKVRPLQALLVISLILFFVMIYRMPLGNDVKQFSLQIADMAYRGDFSVSTIGPMSFGIDESMPRWNAHLFHSLHSLFAALTDYDPVSISRWMLAAPLGGAMLLALYFFLRVVTGNQIPPVYLIFSIVGPLCLFFWVSFANAYIYSFRILNCPSLDKDFALFFLLPSLLYCSVRFVKESDWRFLILLLGLIIPSIYFHPMTAIYFLVSGGIVATGFLGRETYQRIALIAIFALSLFSFNYLTGNAQSSHDSIDAIVKHDFEEHQEQFLARDSSYWRGHYASIPGVETRTIDWPNGRMSLKPDLFLESPLIFYSSLFTVIWTILLALRRYKGQSIDEGETSCLVIQYFYLAFILALFVFSPLLLEEAPYLYRGFERLHWMYFGFFSFIYVSYHFANRVIAAARQRLPVELQDARISQSGNFLASVILCIILLESATSLYFNRTTVLVRIPGLGSVADRYPDLTAEIEHASIEDPYINPPDWLRDDDLIFVDSMSGMPGVPARTWIARQSAFYRELYVEAFAFEKKGRKFLETRDAAYDGFHKKPTPRFIRWLNENRVSIIVSDNEAFIQKIASLGEFNVTNPAPQVWRIRHGDDP